MTKNANSNEGFDCRSAITYVEALHAISDLDVNVSVPVLADGSNMLQVCYSTDGCKRSCPRYGTHADGAKWDEVCSKMHFSAGMLADRHGGRYIYTCPEKKIYIAAPVMSNRRMSAILTVGPVEVTEDEDDDPVVYPGYGPFVQCNCKTIENAALLLGAAALALSDQLQSYLRLAGGYDANSRINVSKAIRKSKRLNVKDYPIASEKRLMASLAAGDAIASSAALDQIFGYLLSYDQNEEDFYLHSKRMIELVTIISHTALDAGVDSNIVFRASEQCRRELGYMNSDVQIYRRLRYFVDETCGYVQSLLQIDYDDALYRVRSYIQEHFREKMGLEQIAAAIGYSPSYLSRVFKEKMGINLIAYLNQVRIEAGMADLRTTDMSVTEVARRNGFASVNYFSRVFKRSTGVTPGYYRTHRGKTNV